MLLALAVGIAVLGVVNTVALSVLERRREFGVLRALGIDRRRPRAVVRWESSGIALGGAPAGLALGLYGGAVLARALGGPIESVGFPWPRLALVVAAAVVVGMVAAVPPRPLGRVDVLAALRHG